MTLAVHLCRRNWGRRGWGAAGGYEAILPHLQRLKVEQLLLEFSIPVAGDVAVLRELPEDVQDRPGLRRRALPGDRDARADRRARARRRWRTSPPSG